MRISIIAAASENNVIGNRGKLPWHLPADLKHFRKLTEGHPVIMGRKTYESILRLRSGHSVGRPLPKRRNIVISRKKGLKLPGCEVASSLEEALRVVQTHLPREAPGGAKWGTPTPLEVFIIGGGEIYKEAMPLADRIYLTRVHAVFEGDTFFPKIEESEWTEVSREEHEADRENLQGYTFVTYERQKST